MGLAVHTYDRLRGVTTTALQGQSISDTLLSYLSVISITGKQIAPFIPPNNGTTSRLCFRVLIAITGLDRPTKRNISVYGGFHEGSCSKAVDHLHTLALIKTINKPRLIIPFGAYKIDTGYVITALGERVLLKILNHK